MPSFSYVLIPADENEPIISLELQYKKKDIVGCFGKTINDHFRKFVSKDQDKYKDAIKQQLGQHASSVTEDMMEKIHTMTMFGQIPLLKPFKENGYESVNMYIDDQGQAKGLTENRRASQITFAINDPQTILGDAFIARVIDDQHDLFERKDLTKEEISIDAKWMKIAIEQNKNRTVNSREKAEDEFKAMISTKKSCRSTGCSKEGIFRCSRCKTAYYCSAECQRMDWSRHKLGCKV